MTGPAGSAQGWGDIAVEIRRLSEQAQEALTAVSRHMQGMRKDIETVSGAVAGAAREAVNAPARIEQTGAFFETIFGLVEEQAGASEEIARQMERLSQSAVGIVETMAMVAQHSQASRARTRRAAQEMQKLAMQAQQLRLSVEVFKLTSDHLPSEQDAPKEALEAWSRNQPPETRMGDGEQRSKPQRTRIGM